MSYRISWNLDPALALTVPVIDLSNADDARQSLASAATVEIYDLLEMLRREQAFEHEHGKDTFHHVFGSTMRRLVALNDATCRAVSCFPDAEPPAAIADVIFGSDGWRDSRDPGDTTPTATFSAK